MSRWLDNAVGAFADSAFDTYRNLQDERRAKEQEKRDAAAEKRQADLYDQAQQDRAAIRAAGKALADSVSGANQNSSDAISTAATTAQSINNVAKDVDGGTGVTLGLSPSGDIELVPGLPSPAGELYAAPTGTPGIPVGNTSPVTVTPQDLGVAAGGTAVGGDLLPEATLAPAPPTGGIGLPSATPDSPMISVTPENMGEVSQEVQAASRMGSPEGSPASQMISTAGSLARMATTPQQYAQAVDLLMRGQAAARNEATAYMSTLASTDPVQYMSTINQRLNTSLSFDKNDEGGINIYNNGELTGTYRSVREFHEVAAKGEMTGDPAAATQAWLGFDNARTQRAQHAATMAHNNARLQLQADIEGYSDEQKATRAGLLDLYDEGDAGGFIEAVERFGVTDPDAVWEQISVPTYTDGMRDGSRVVTINKFQPQIDGFFTSLSDQNNALSGLTKNLVTAMVSGDDDLVQGTRGEIDEYVSAARAKPVTGAWRLLMNTTGFQALYAEKYAAYQQGLTDNPPPTGDQGAPTGDAGGTGDAPTAVNDPRTLSEAFEAGLPQGVAGVLTPGLKRTYSAVDRGIIKPINRIAEGVYDAGKWVTGTGGLAPENLFYHGSTGQNQTLAQPANTPPPVEGTLQPPPGWTPKQVLTDGMERRTTERGLPAPMAAPEFTPWQMPTDGQPNPGFDLDPWKVQQPGPVEAGGQETARRGTYTDRPDPRYVPERGMPSRPVYSNDAVYQPTMPSQPRPDFPMQPLQNMSAVQGTPLNAPPAAAPSNFLENVGAFQQLLAMERAGAPRNAPERQALEQEVLEILRARGLTVQDAWNTQAPRR